MSCATYLLQYQAKFLLHDLPQMNRVIHACQCFCPKHNGWHYCYRPEVFTEYDRLNNFGSLFEVLWCCLVK
jgi:hypothetical protein